MLASVLGQFRLVPLWISRIPVWQASHSKRNSLVSQGGNCSLGTATADPNSYKLYAWLKDVVGVLNKNTDYPNPNCENVLLYEISNQRV